MMTVTLNRDINAGKVLEIVAELRSQGLHQGMEFDFAYYQAQHDPINGHLVKEPHAIFTFYDSGEYALIFKLKYGT
jgi:hypothetical protein